MGRNKDAHADGSLKRHSWLRMLILPFGKHARVYNANNRADTRDNIATIKRNRTAAQEVKQLKRDGILK
jgi:hypothetical protein